MAIGGALGCMSMSYGNTTVCVKSAVVVRSRRVPQWRAQSIAQQKSKSNQTAQILLSEFRQASATPLDRLRQVSDDMTAEMHAGLLAEGGSQQLKMLPTYVEHLPTGLVPLFPNCNAFIKCVSLHTTLRLVEKICRIVTSCVRRIDPVYMCKFMVAADCMKSSWKNVIFEADLLSVHKDCVSLDWKSLHNRSGSFCNLSSVFK